MKLFFVLFVIGLLLDGVVFAGCDDWEGGDVSIEYHPKIGRSCQIAVAGDHMINSAPAASNHTLHEVLSDQLLEGYCFLPEMLAGDRSDPLLRRSKVRAVVCYKSPFFSEELRRTLQCVSQMLWSDQAGIFSAPFGWKKLTGEMMDQHLFPEGKTRRWSVISRKDVRRRTLKDRVCILLRNEDDALEGVLCREEELREGEREKSLLDIKRELQVPSPVVGCSIPSYAELLQLSCGGSQFNLGISYFDKRCQRASALMDVSGLTLDMTYTLWGESYSERVSLLAALKKQILRGYRLKSWRKDPQLSDMDIDVWCLPHVRGVIGERQKFSADLLSDMLQGLKVYINDGTVRLLRKPDCGGNPKDHGGVIDSSWEKKINNSLFWQGLESWHLDAIAPTRFVWSMRSVDEVASRDVCAGSVYVFIKGEREALYGEPRSFCQIFAHNGRSLFDYVVEKELRDCAPSAKKLNVLELMTRPKFFVPGP